MRATDSNTLEFWAWYLFRAFAVAPNKSSSAWLYGPRGHYTANSKRHGAWL